MRIRAGNTEYISRDTIKRLTGDLAEFGFVRIDRSILLNIRAVEFAEPVGHGTLAFTLSSGNMPALHQDIPQRHLERIAVASLPSGSWALESIGREQATHSLISNPRTRAQQHRRTLAAVGHFPSVNGHGFPP